MMDIRKSENGQALYLLVVAIVSLIGFTALAIDGGRLYSERRIVQGVSDTAAFTGAVYLGHAPFVDESMKTYAIAAANQIAKDNGYDDSSADVSVTTTVSEVGYYYHVTTQITSQIDPTFAQLIFHGPLEVKVQAVTRVLPLYQVVFGDALFSLNETQCDAMKFSGTADISITGTGIFSNSNCNAGTDQSISFEGTNDTYIEGSISAVGGINTQGGATWTAGAGSNTGVPTSPPFSIPIPNCSGMAPVSISGPVNDRTITPGIVDSLLLNNPSTTYTFGGGLYCITGVGGLVISNGYVNGSDVMFYVVQGPAYLTGGTMNLTAPNAYDDPIVDSSNEPFSGLLIYMDPSNTNEVRINGNADSNFEGTIYAPSSLCKLNGGGETDGIDLSMVCDTINVNGGAGLNIHYDDANHYRPPTTIDLVQ
jgi:hypothetical protein